MKSLTFIQNMKLYVKKIFLCNLFLPCTLSMLAYIKELQTEIIKLYNTHIVTETE